MAVVRQDLKEAARYLDEYPHPRDCGAYFLGEQPSSYVYLWQIHKGDKIIGYGTVTNTYEMRVGGRLMRYLMTDTGYTSLTFPPNEKIALA